MILPPKMKHWQIIVFFNFMLTFFGSNASIRHIQIKNASYFSLSQDLNFKTVSDLRQRLESHINGVHLNKKPHKCPHCDFASAYQGHVKDHIRASHDAVKYPCPYPACNHQSSYKGNLDKHIKNIHASKIDAPIENAKTVPHLD